MLPDTAESLLIKELDPEHTKYLIPVSIRAKPSSGTHLHQVMRGLSFEGKGRNKSREGMTGYRNSQYSPLPYCCTVAHSFLCLIFFLPPSWPNEILSISQQSYPIRPLPCLCPDLPPRHLPDASRVRVSLVYTVGIYTLSPIQLYTHTRAHDQQSMGF